LALAWFGALAGCDEQSVDTELGDVVEGAAIVVVVDGTENTVELATLPRTPAPDGTDAVRLSDVLTAVVVDGSLGERVCDFVASDGFRTSTKGEGCEPLDCSRTVDASLLLPSQDVIYPVELTMRGCYQPRALVRIEAWRP